MKNLKILIAPFVIFFMFGFYSCEKDQFFTNQGIMSDQDVSLQATSLDRRLDTDCFEINTTEAKKPLTCVNVPANVAPLGCPEGYKGLGVAPFELTVGDYKGKFGFVVTDMKQIQPGELHLKITHYFIAGDGSFWTEDQVVCTPGNASSTHFDNPVCDVNNIVKIAGGSGVFKGVTGKINSTGKFTFDGDNTPCSNCFEKFAQIPAGNVEIKVSGGICNLNDNPNPWMFVNDTEF